jgi:ribonuclease HI
MEAVIVNCDGGSRGNPGKSALGVVIKTAKGEIIEEVGEYLGVQTNNYAECMAVVKAIEVLRQKDLFKADFYLDSELVVKQINGEYKIKSENIAHLHQRIKELSKGMELSFSHVYRKDNTEADKIVNQVLDSTL